jgi:hypothetical protein
LTDTLNIYYKKDMLSLPLYMVNGELFYAFTCLIDLSISE